ncbi:MAG TPA: DoxX family protein [Vicinamibacteria bacterium]|nr:DoxX family protein [Vicinamibacteria bacterium]
MARDIGLLILRLAGLYLAAGHGWGKLVGLASGQSRFVEGVANMGFPMPVLFAWAAGLAEFAGGLAMALGLFTRWAALLAGCTMFVAAFVRHRALSQLLSWLGVAPATEEALRGWGNPELATIFLIVCVAVALLGPGRFSIDAKLGRK